MTLGKLTSLTLAATLLATLPATAGAPDDPGEKGALVNERKDVWQGYRGTNGWGSRVSEIARNSGGNSDTNLGSYLSESTDGPNPASDNGKGND